MDIITNTKEIEPDIRLFLSRDLEQIRRVENSAFLDYPWTTEDFIIFLRNQQHKAYIAEWRDVILGFMLCIEGKWEYEIVSIAVNPSFRGGGVGTRLVSYLKNKLIPYGRETIYAFVRKTNQAARGFFESQNFKVVETLVDYYEHTDEPCLKMKYKMEELPLKEEYLKL